MKIKTLFILLAIIVVVMFLESIYTFNLLPENIQLPSHWNTRGEVDGYMGKIPGLFLLPLIFIVSMLIFFGIPYIDPLRKNIEMFRANYNLFIFAFSVFFLIMNTVIIMWAMDYQISINKALLPAFAFLFHALGIMLSSAKRNYVIGIRLPWTLNSDENWNKTHSLGGKLFKYGSFVLLFGIFLDSSTSFIFLFVFIFLALIITIVYSYLFFLKEKKLNS